jgi:hypothetical protein
MKTLFVLLAIALIGVFGWHYCAAHTVPPANLSKLKVGMDWTTAKAIIGTTTTPIARPDGTYFVAFRKHDRWCMVDLILDSGHHITSIFHDH